MVEKFEVLKLYGKWLMAGQHVSKSCKYFKTRKIDLLVFENLENSEQFEKKTLNLIEIDSKWLKMVIF